MLGGTRGAGLDSDRLNGTRGRSWQYTAIDVMVLRRLPRCWMSSGCQETLAPAASPDLLPTPQVSGTYPARRTLCEL
jgi:hypothetical protein